MTAFESFMSLRGQPKFCYSDSGSQLKAAKRELLVDVDMCLDERPSIVWQQVREKTRGMDMIWKIAPPGAQNRDGRSERAIAALKKSMKHLYVSRDLNLLEFQMLLRKAANCLNDRPLAIYDVTGDEPGVAPLTPNLLLQNFKTEGPVDPLDKYEEATDKLLIRMKYMFAQYESWWDHWYRAVFSSLVPYKRWKHDQRNLKPGDVCLIMYKGRIPVADYRLCRVIETFPDEEGLVRTVKVAMVSRDKRRKILPHNTQPLVEMTVAIQRLVLIHPVDVDQEDKGEKEVAKVNIFMAREWPLLKGTSDSK